ncbi:MAG: mannose-6-phosphate isomerase, partial [Clostridia bacterium]|nr:mannose-6-phosphate isomerase [Clostridia bacterium]
VYDYGRKDKNGNERELHIEKALKVTNLKKFEPITFDGCLGQCEYFTVTKHVINGEMALFADETSFHCVTCVKGVGFIENMEIKQGDSCFIPADYGKYTVNGKTEIILIKV